jgi:hypothetical protein
VRVRARCYDARVSTPVVILSSVIVGAVAGVELYVAGGAHAVQLLLMLATGGLVGETIVRR